MLHLNCTDFWADYFLCCHNANKPWFLTGELVIQGLAWLFSFMQLQFAVYMRETIILECNVYCYFRKMGHSGWWVPTCQQVATTLPFPVQVGGAEEMGEFFPGAKRPWQVESCWEQNKHFSVHLTQCSSSLQIYLKKYNPPFFFLFFYIWLDSTHSSQWFSYYGSLQRYPLGYFPVWNSRKWKYNCLCKIHSLRKNW